MNAKLDAAIAYLRERKKYITDPGCKFVYVDSANTNIAETIRLYRLEVEKQPAVKLVGRKK
jgi:hypothetical protein